MLRRHIKHAKLPVKCVVSPNYWRYVQSQCRQGAIITSSWGKYSFFRWLGGARLAIKG